jgi:hypothetical protein
VALGFFPAICYRKGQTLPSGLSARLVPGLQALKDNQHGCDQLKSFSLG